MGFVMASDYEFILPLVVYLPRKTVKDKRFSVDINTIRGADRHSYNAAKKVYSEVMSEQLSGFDMIDNQIKVHYQYYAAMNNSPDLDNFIGGAKKFFQDAMVNHGLIKDDNVNFIPRNSEEYMGIDRLNPRIVAKVTVLD